MKKILHNIFWLLLENGTRIFLALFANFILARALGVEQFGLIQYALSLIVIFSAISFICGAEIIVPMLSNSKGRKVEGIIGNVFILRLFFSTLAYLLILIYTFFFEEKLEIFYLVSILGLTILSGESFAVISAWLQANTNSKPRSLLVIVSSFLKCGTIASLYYMKIYDVKYYAIAWVLEAYVIAVGLYLIYKKYTNYRFFVYSRVKLCFFLRKGVPFFVSLLLLYAFIRMDIMLLKNYSDLYTVGIYSAAYQLITALSVIAPILSMSIAPSMVYKSDVSNVKLRVVYIALGMGGVAILLAIPMAYFSEWILLVIYGVEFKDAIIIFNYLLVAMIFYFINEGFNIYFLKIGKGKLYSIKWLLVLIVSIVVYMYCIPRYQAIGGVIGYASGYVVSILFSIFILYFDRSLIVKNKG